MRKKTQHRKTNTSQYQFTLRFSQNLKLFSQIRRLLTYNLRIKESSNENKKKVLITGSLSYYGLHITVIAVVFKLFIVV